MEILTKFNEKETQLLNEYIEKNNVSLSQFIKETLAEKLELNGKIEVKVID